MSLQAALREHLGHDAVVELGTRSTHHTSGARVHLTAAHALIGPWVPAGGVRDVCGECLRQRWLRVRTDSERAVLTGTDLRRSEHSWPPAVRFLVDAVLAAVHITDDSDVPDPGRSRGYVTSVDLQSLATRTLLVERDPLCPACATWADDTATSVHLQPRPRRAGATRLAELSSYDLDDRALVNPFCGTVGSLAHVDLGSTTTAPVAGAMSGRDGPGSAELTWSGQQPRYATSRKIGFLEGLERYSGASRRSPLRPVIGAFDSLDHAVDPRTIGVYATSTYAEDPHLTPFDPAASIAWVWAWSLRDRKPVLVAERNAFYGGHGPDRFVDECSSGCATGSCPEEAMLYGLLEVLERDAFLLAWYGAAALPVIEIEPSLGPEVLTLVTRAELMGYEVTLLDNRSDIGVPVVTALARRRDERCSLVLASAAALRPQEAVEAALGEVLTYLPGRPLQVARRRAALEAMRSDYTLVRELRDHAELFALPSMRAVVDTLVDEDDVAAQGDRFADCPAPGSDLTDDLTAVVERLAASGFDVVAVDQTSAEQRRAGVASVRMIVPGLVPIDFGWSRQRALTMPRLLERGEALRLVPHPFP